ncbi:SusC/RagA family TonB-linked outer membrane protein [Sphingobacterium spiritivorum]|uniref:SusC/RagA family TonB-linked outer membrane protein n=1 Tax=Sphingobacterium spiritivorum TaxID=258 RepID=UPI003DA2DF37
MKFYLDHLVSCQIRHINKTRCLMRIHLTVIMFTTFFIQISTATYAQRISLHKSNVPLSQVFKEIGKQTGYDFVYSTELMKKTQNVSVDVSNASLEETLDACFINQPLDYQIDDNSIIIKAKISAKKTVSFISFAQTTITGWVTDESNKPLSGVTVRYANSKITTITDFSGKYSISIPNSNEELIFTHLGYVVYKIKPGNEKVIPVVLKLSSNELDGVVVTGLYSRPIENFTGAATTVTGKELRDVNSMNVLQALKVFDPAIRMPDNIQMGSNPNTLPQISLRGTNNFPTQGASSTIPSSGADFMSAYISNPSMPLFILDGFEVSLQKIYDLDINRVASITILKDAVGTSAYGSRASNGVIVVETIRPKEGKLQLNYTSTLQITGPDLSSYKLLNASDKLELELIAGMYKDRGQDPVNQLYYDKLYSKRRADVEKGVNTYWLYQPLQVGIGNKQSLYVEGGDEFIRYGVNFGYTANSGVMKSSSRKNYEGGMLLSYRKKGLLVRNQLNLSANRADESPWGSFGNYSSLNQYWSPYDENGKLRKIMEVTIVPGYGNSERVYTNPMYNATLGTANYSKYTGFNNNTMLEWRLDNGLRLSGRLGISSQKDQSDLFLPADHTAFATITNYNSLEYFNRGRYTKSNGSFMAYDAGLFADYSRSFNRHLFFGTLGLSAAQQTSESYGITVTGFPNTRLDEVFLGNSYLKDSRPSGKNNISRRVSAFTSLNYTYNKRYLADFSFNMDGSTQFGAQNRFAPFWAAGVGWNLHEEKFIAGLTGNVINRFRIRAGVGTTGNQQFPPFMGISTYQYNTSKDYLGMLGASLMGYGNEALKWQQTLKKNLGADISLFNDRIGIRLDAYIETTNDLLLDINTPPSLGVSSYKENVGRLQNKGIEGNINFILLRNPAKSTTWSVFVSGIHNQNKILEISNSLKKTNEENDAELNPNGSLKQVRPQLRFQEGESVNAIWAVRSAGIDPSNGQEIYIKTNGDITYDWSASDKVIVGDALPTLRGNMGTNLSYKGLQLSLYFNYQWKGQLYNQTLADRIENANLALNVDERVLLGRWQNPGDRTFFKGIRDLDGFPVTTPTNTTSRFVQRDNFLQLESLSLGYVFPDKTTAKWGLRNTRIGFQANTLLRFGSIQAERGLDYPFARNFTFNLSTSF